MRINNNDLIIAFKWGIVAALHQWSSYRGKAAGLNDKIMVNLAARGAIAPHYLNLWGFEYGVLRGSWIADAVRMQNIAKVSAALHAAYSVPGGIKSGKDAADRWEKAIGYVAAITGQRNQSLCSKALWLYAPSAVPLFDDYAQKALSVLHVTLDIPRPQPGTLGFLNAFEGIFAAYEPLIQQLQDEFQAVTGREPYIFPRRVLDKGLWFLACPDRVKAMRELRRDAPWAAKFLPTPAKLLGFASHGISVSV